MTTKRAFTLSLALLFIYLIIQVVLYINMLICIEYDTFGIQISRQGIALLHRLTKVQAIIVILFVIVGLVISFLRSNSYLTYSLYFVMLLLNCFFLVQYINTHNTFISSVGNDYQSTLVLMKQSIRPLFLCSIVISFIMALLLYCINKHKNFN